MKFLKGLIYALIILFSIAVGNTQPPVGSDPNSPVAKYFHSLHDKTGRGCCDISDCRFTNDWRKNDNNYEVKIDDKWFTIDNDKVISYPTWDGRAVVCYHQIEAYTDSYFIYCFNPGLQG